MLELASEYDVNGVIIRCDMRFCLFRQGLLHFFDYFCSQNSDVMTKDELLQRLQDIEWEDCECKQAKSELPKNVWETVSAFSNTSGGWIVLGVREEKVGKAKTFVIEGVGNAEKLEQDLIGTLRSKSKFNVTIPVRRRIRTGRAADS